MSKKQIETTQTKIGALIKKTREARKMKVDDLAEGICDPKQIYRYEKGQSMPNFEYLVKIFNRLDLNLNIILEEENLVDFYYIKALTISSKKALSNLTKSNLKLLEKLVNIDIKEKITLSNKSEASLLKLKALVQTRLYNNTNKANELLDSAFKLIELVDCDKTTMTEEQIKTSLIKIQTLAMENNYEEAFKLTQRALTSVKLLQLKEHGLVSKVVICLSKINSKYKVSKKLLLKELHYAIDYAKMNRCFENLEWIYFNLFLIYISSNKKELAIKAANTSLYYAQVDKKRFDIIYEAISKHINVRLLAFRSTHIDNFAFDIDSADSIISEEQQKIETDSEYAELFAEIKKITKEIEENNEKAKNASPGDEDYRIICVY